LKKFSFLSKKVMRFDLITCLPELFEGFLNQSIVKRAQNKQLIDIHIHNLRDFTTDKHKQVDDYAFGGSAGMVLKPEPLAAAIRFLQAQRSYDLVIYTSPDGQTFNQSMANRLSLFQNLLLICGHYKGIDQRIRDLFVNQEISIGDYVLSGGELAAAVIVDAVARLIPGVLSDETSALTDSFQDGMLAPPVYTRPADFEGHKVPDVLLSGHEANIKEWQTEQSLRLTESKRPDLFQKLN
jgi:tRNA (guanine37-N1)-methyltransferase